MKRLMYLNTGNYMLLDQCDFDVMKHTRWFERPKLSPINESGIPFEVYVSVTHLVRKKEAPLNDYRRMWYA